MYQSCMFCHKPLGANEVIETFPVGRRLAFDAARGRLWVVCRKCERWNLSPLEERWEAVEDCERIFRATRVRVSTENIGLARHPEGLSLVRIGEPMRPEFAAWRYGDQFGRRRRRTIIYGATVVVVAGGLVTGALATGIVSASVLQFGHLVRLVTDARTVVKLQTRRGGVIKLKDSDLTETRLLPDEDEPGFAIVISKGKESSWHVGAEARQFAAAILPRFNAMGGTKETVRRAVDRIEQAGHPERFLWDIASRDLYCDRKGVPGYIHKMPKPTRLALEMALHEEQERRALEGELWQLERAWKEAEEIAEISDNLFLPEGTEDFIREHGAKQNDDKSRRDPS